MVEYIFDAEKSKEVFDISEKQIQVKQCYNNVFRVVTDNIHKFKSNQWRVAYGYTNILDNILCRHCFILDENNKVIDVTVYAKSTLDLDRKYYVMKIFEDINTYFDAIEKDEFYPALEFYLRAENKKANEWAMQNGFILTG